MTCDYQTWHYSDLLIFDLFIKWYQVKMSEYTNTDPSQTAPKKEESVKALNCLLFN